MKKIWSSAKADKKFSKWICRNGVCEKCHQVKNEPLSCSHFWSRNKSATRYEPDNCICLHLWSCHIYGWEKEKQGEYRDYMVKRLGKKRYDELKDIYYQSKMTRREAIIKVMELLTPLK